jgi:hypothetical protein
MKWWNLDPAALSAMSAIAGSVVGVLGSTVSAWIAQRHQDRRERLAAKIAQREQLYAGFISEAAALLVDAMEHSLQDPSKLVPIYAFISRIRLSSSTSVVESAERLIDTILNTYQQPNLRPEDIQTDVNSRHDHLHEFSDTCRAELESLWNGF